MTTGLTVSLCQHCLEPVDDPIEHQDGSGRFACERRKIGQRCQCGHRIRGRNHFLGAHHNGTVPRNPTRG